MVFDKSCHRKRVKLLKSNINVFPSSIKTHKPDNWSVLGHKTSGDRILHFYSFFLFLYFFPL